MQRATCTKYITQKVANGKAHEPNVTPFSILNSIKIPISKILILVQISIKCTKQKSMHGIWYWRKISVIIWHLSGACARFWAAQSAQHKTYFCTQSISFAMLCLNCAVFSCSSWNFRFCVKWILISLHIEVTFTWLFLVVRQTRWNAIAWKWANVYAFCIPKQDHRSECLGECYMVPDATILRANSYAKI